MSAWRIRASRFGNFNSLSMLWEYTGPISYIHNKKSLRIYELQYCLRLN